MRSLSVVHQNQGSEVRGQRSRVTVAVEPNSAGVLVRHAAGNGYVSGIIGNRNWEWE